MMMKTAEKKAPEDPVDVPKITCTKCGGDLLAEVGPPQSNSRPAVWTCPSCGIRHEHDFGGKLHWIAKAGDDSSPVH